MKNLKTQVCIIGGGPTGMFLGLMLAKLGVEVLILEKNKNFERQYNGEILTPDFLDTMKKLNLIDYLESYPHMKVEKGNFYYKNKKVASLDYDKLNQEIKYSLWMPQQFLLEAIHKKAYQYPNFNLKLSCDIKEVMADGEKIEHLKVKFEDQTFQVKADLFVAADGKDSIIRKKMQNKLRRGYYKNDIVWFTFEKPQWWEGKVGFHYGEFYHYIFTQKSPTKIQCGIAMDKTEWKKIKEDGIVILKKKILFDLPFMSEPLMEIADFQKFTRVQSKLFYVKNWAGDNYILFGDASHSSSIAGSIGVLLGINTAIVSSTMIEKMIKTRTVNKKELEKIEKIRRKEIDRVQKIQMFFEPVILPQTKFKRALGRFIIKWGDKTPFSKIIQKRYYNLKNDVGADDRLKFK